jgi:hypothetical protein
VKVLGLLSACRTGSLKTTKKKNILLKWKIFKEFNVKCFSKVIVKITKVKLCYGLSHSHDQCHSILCEKLL